jgi:hypothetical protein
MELQWNSISVIYKFQENLLLRREVSYATCLFGIPTKLVGLIKMSV